MQFPDDDPIGSNGKHNLSCHIPLWQQGGSHRPWVRKARSCLCIWSDQCVFFPPHYPPDKYWKVSGNTSKRVVEHFHFFLEVSQRFLIIKTRRGSPVDRRHFQCNFTNRQNQPIQPNLKRCYSHDEWLNDYMNMVLGKEPQAFPGLERHKKSPIKLLKIFVQVSN